MCLLTILFIAIQFFPALCMGIPAPVNLTISSQSFVHLLSWKMGQGSPDGIYYTVRMRTLSNGSLVVVNGCEKVISPLLCNLTEVFSEEKETYYTSVSATLGNQTSSYTHCSPFKPILNTTLIPPLLAVTICNQSLCVSLKAPSPKLFSIYSSELNYRLTFSSEDGTEFYMDTEGLTDVIFKDLASRRRYCVTVSIIDRSPFSRSPVCVSIPTDGNASDAVIFVILCLLMVMLLMGITPKLVSHYFYLKADLPAVLSSFKNQYMVKAILFTAAESINHLSEDTEILKDMKRNKDEIEEMEGERQKECIVYERLGTNCLSNEDIHSSSPFVCSSSSSSGSILDKSLEKNTCVSSFTDIEGRSLSAYEGGHVSEPKASVEFMLKAAVNSVFENPPTHGENKESSTDEVESGKDVNLFSVILGSLELEQHKTEGENIGLSPKRTIEIAASSRPFDSQSQNFEPLGLHHSDTEDDDEYSGYLSRD